MFYARSSKLNVTDSDYYHVLLVTPTEILCHHTMTRYSIFATCVMAPRDSPSNVERQARVAISINMIRFVFGIYILFSTGVGAQAQFTCVK